MDIQPVAALETVATGSCWADVEHNGAVAFISAVKSSLFTSQTRLPAPPLELNRKVAVQSHPLPCSSAPSAADAPQKSGRSPDLRRAPRLLRLNHCSLSISAPGASASLPRGETDQAASHRSLHCDVVCLFDDSAAGGGGFCGRRGGDWSWIQVSRSRPCSPGSQLVQRLRRCRVTSTVARTVSMGPASALFHTGPPSPRPLAGGLSPETAADPRHRGAFGSGPERRTCGRSDTSAR